MSVDFDKQKEIEKFFTDSEDELPHRNQRNKITTEQTQAVGTYLLSKTDDKKSIEIINHLMRIMLISKTMLQIEDLDDSVSRDLLTEAICDFHSIELDIKTTLEFY